MISIKDLSYRLKCDTKYSGNKLNRFIIKTEAIKKNKLCHHIAP